MHLPDTKLPRDIRQSLTELFDPRSLLGAKMTELFGMARQEVNAAFATVKNEVTDRISREWTETQQRLERMGSGTGPHDPSALGGPCQRL